MMPHPRSRGFSLVEVLVALLVFAVGALGLAAEVAALTRLVARSRLAGRVSAAAAVRLELLQSRGCGDHTNGTELVLHGGTALAALHWTWTPTVAGYEVRLVTAPGPLTMGRAAPAETLRAVVRCES